MTDRIRVGHICGPGLWKRAPLLTPDGRKATAIHERPPTGSPWEAWTLPARLHDVTDDWHVCLDDSRGLGLAGLAATVGLRLGILQDGRHPVSCTPWFVVKQWTDAGYPLAHADTFTQLVEISTRLRLTDDLCKANDVPRQEHEVATWTRGVDSEGAVTWSLGVQSCDYEYTWRFDVDDWQAALEAVLAEVSRG